MCSDGRSEPGRPCAEAEGRPPTTVDGFPDAASTRRAAARALTLFPELDTTKAAAPAPAPHMPWIALVSTPRELATLDTPLGPPRAHPMGPSADVGCAPYVDTSCTGKSPAYAATNVSSLLTRTPDEAAGCVGSAHDTTSRFASVDTYVGAYRRRRGVQPPTGASTLGATTEPWYSSPDSTEASAARPAGAPSETGWPGVTRTSPWPVLGATSQRIPRARSHPPPNVARSPDGPRKPTRTGRTIDEHAASSRVARPAPAAAFTPSQQRSCTSSGRVAAGMTSKLLGTGLGCGSTPTAKVPFDADPLCPGGSNPAATASNSVRDSTSIAGRDPAPMASSSRSPDMGATPEMSIRRSLVATKASPRLSDDWPQFLRDDVGW